MTARGDVKVLHVETPVGRLYVERTGDGPAMLLWPHLFCDGRSLAAQAAEFARDHRVLVVDGPGHGLSARPPARFTIADCARAAAAVLDAAGARDAIVLGSGWGGLVGVALAADAPARVRALVLANVPLDRAPFLRRVELGGLTLLFRLLGPRPRLAAGVLHELFSPSTRKSHPERVALVAESLRLCHRPGLADAMAAVLVTRPSLVRMAARLRVPVLCLTGDDDRLFPPRRAELQALRIPGARFEVVEGTARLSPLEAPKRVNALIRQFLSSLSAAGPALGRRTASPVPSDTD
ncbi:MAG: alpha/beta hydrolase [bacterium]